MMEQNWLGDPVKSPEIQEIILSNRIGSIAAELAKRLEIAPILGRSKSLYTPQTFWQIP